MDRRNPTPGQRFRMRDKDLMAAMPRAKLRTVVGRGFRNANQGPTIVAEAISLAGMRHVSMPARTASNHDGSTACGGGYDRCVTSSGLTH